MPNHPVRRPVALIAWCSTAAIGAATATGAAATSTYAVCAVGLFALGGGALAAYRTVRASEDQTDRAVLERLRRDPGLTSAGLAADLGLRPAAVRLSLHRLAAASQLPGSAAPPGPGR
ncbi:AsnC family protein [Streptomyces sp. MJM8645]|uniref:winged helix-turn-helix transcriptional regulator n=1 Tax=Streptomycetaceae TaxID=2062 RepID=UPI0007AF0CEE|nr:AsnC family protein [Streptomyces sp. MJM8645]